MGYHTLYLLVMNEPYVSILCLHPLKFILFYFIYCCEELVNTNNELTLNDTYMPP
jgi:hypothetical protein